MELAERRGYERLGDVARAAGVSGGTLSRWLARIDAAAPLPMGARRALRLALGPGVDRILIPRAGAGRTPNGRGVRD